MRRAYFTAPNKVQVLEEECPVIKDSQILVKIAYCGICTLEQRLYAGSRTIFYPIVGGHEASGTIVAVGKDVATGHAVNDRVVLDLVKRCHTCPACLSGNSNLCESRHKDTSQILGGFSQYRVVEPEQAFVIPPSLSLSDATFVEPLSCCLRSLKKLQVGLGTSLLVIGCGTMGMLHVKSALAMGVRVFVSDIDEKRLDVARLAGADGVSNASDFAQCIREVKAFTNGRGVEACSITSPSSLAAELAFQVLCPGGRVNVFTSYDEKPVFPIDMNTLHRNEYSITGSEGRTEMDFYQAVKAISYKKICTSDLISGVFPLSDIATALEAAGRNDTYRILVKVGDE
ncbi:theronine dehydrogenase-like Zn-dependent dehydrogenase [Sphaerochaeta pleomorpha str. Grapes]|uniref:Theronine dehydrogenase-like Zn-dependent dehydrogenase n=1 Tax=Sphaerochaeta pleomorpha (strain ATCC BAA-1885 / DSM 22778 / Grapes) TaxID=158190 RepID=G8QTR3_SPHPG|nr:alcohol dehydrogenase catalytic domain-containing protein [Sphaerochaeta pleomorpha]AEV28028.1 theronine dehydrogenase-like Zn-dependent dehydrogenase [Sphaerochaeta pleomorpha str. Grapes]